MPGSNRDEPWRSMRQKAPGSRGVQGARGGDCARAIRAHIRHTLNLMSVQGHWPTQCPVGVMCALLPIADIRQCRWDFRKVPTADKSQPSEREIAVNYRKVS